MHRKVMSVSILRCLRNESPIYHFNLYDKPFESPEAEDPEWDIVRRNVGQTVEYANKLDLANSSPRNDLSTTGFCLANPGNQYVVYQPGDTPFTVFGLRKGTSYCYQRYDTGKHKVVRKGEIRASGPKKLFTPTNKRTVLYLTSLPSSS
jgi:hypothetical protein